VTASLELKGGAPVRPLREGRAPVRERLMAMLFLTALLHAIVILGLTFTSAGHSSVSDSPQLDVLLVTNEVPEAQANDKAAYLSQRTQIGNGNTDAPSPPASPSSQGTAISEEPSGDGDGKDPGSRAQDKSLLSSTAPSADIRYLNGSATAGSTIPMPQFIGDRPGEPRSGRGDAVELLLRGKTNRERWITPDTRASQLAPYLASWKRKVERVGTLNFPTAARNSHLSGSPVVEVEITADGRLRQAQVRHSSGHGALDEAALTVLKLASPFDPFPPDMAAQYARLRFAYQWDFVAGQLQPGAVTSSSDTPSGP
jgi:protein TonB